MPALDVWSTPPCIYSHPSPSLCVYPVLSPDILGTHRRGPGLHPGQLRALQKSTLLFLSVDIESQGRTLTGQAWGICPWEGAADPVTGTQLTA